MVWRSFRSSSPEFCIHPRSLEVLFQFYKETPIGLHNKTERLPFSFRAGLVSALALWNYTNFFFHDHPDAHTDARFHLKVNRHSPFAYATALLTTPRSRKIDALGFGIREDVSPRGLAAAMFLERYRTALRRVKVSKDARGKREHPRNGGNSPQHRFALLEDDDPPTDPFEAFISDDVRSKCHYLRHQPPPTRRKRGGRGIGKKSRTKTDESLEDIQTLQDLAVEIVPITPSSSSPSSPSPRSASTISLSAPSFLTCSCTTYL